MNVSGSVSGVNEGVRQFFKQKVNQQNSPSFGNSERDISFEADFPNGMDERALEYANNIANNVIEKLKISLGLPEDDTTHEQLCSFFCEKFRKPEPRPDFKNYPE